MDIRKYFTKNADSEQDDNNLPSPVRKKKKEGYLDTELLPGPSAISNQITFDSLDLGLYLNSQSITDAVKYKLLKHPYVPGSQYNFKNDVAPNSIRCFKISWLNDYDWMVYSPKLKGALCKCCVLFKPVVKRGVLGAFIIKEFSHYRKLHESAKSHQNSEWHKQSVCAATHFIKIISGKNANVY